MREWIPCICHQGQLLHAQLCPHVLASHQAVVVYLHSLQHFALKGQHRMDHVQDCHFELAQVGCKVKLQSLRCQLFRTLCCCSNRFRLTRHFSCKLAFVHLRLCLLFFPCPQHRLSRLGGRCQFREDIGQDSQHSQCLGRRRQGQVPRGDDNVCFESVAAFVMFQLDVNWQRTDDVELLPLGGHHQHGVLKGKFHPDGCHGAPLWSDHLDRPQIHHHAA
mmetsp:Transcript_27082/g.64449  ORF Transcript_27082/g.64449 Transcript_27082/m.64449 type:complete len:219 (+) Transcript_27082:4587-5243(+)